MLQMEFLDVWQIKISRYMSYPMKINKLLLPFVEKFSFLSSRGFRSNVNCSITQQYA